MIAGGGVGGLAAAQGLLAAGHDVVVFERGEIPVGPSGYRLRLDTRAVDTLERLLPTPVWTALLASGTGSAVNRRLTYLDHHLRVLATARQDDEGLLMLGRGPLLRLLAHGIRDDVRERCAIESFSIAPDSVTVTTADGRTEQGDVLVIADGAGSHLRRQFLHDEGRRPLGVNAISARVSGTAAERGLAGIAGALAEGYVLCSGPGEVGMFLSQHDLSRGAVMDAAALGEVAADVEPPYLVWALIAPESDLPALDADPGELGSAVERLTASWHREMARLPGLCEPDSLQTYPLNAAPPVPTWPTSAVTLLGDAIHVVPPTGGIGAGTAIRDAGHLVDALAVATDRASTLRNLRTYEQTMRGYADSVVDDSVAPLRWQHRLAAPVVHAAVTGALARTHTVAAALARAAR